MTDQLLLLQYHQLPEDLKKEVLDFIGFLKTRYNSQKTGKARPRFGSSKGKYIMSPDFDAPLDIFKDYME